MNDAAGREAEEIMHAPHPAAVAPREVIIHRHDMHALPERALEVLGNTATKVLPSPVRISAILPSCKTMPPRSWTSKGRWPRTRFAASRTAAKASGRSWSRVSPWQAVP